MDKRAVAVLGGEAKGAGLAAKEDFAKAVSDGVVPEVGNAKQPFGGVQGMMDQHGQFGLLAEIVRMVSVPSRFWRRTVSA